jgi:hypothetical protein
VTGEADTVTPPSGVATIIARELRTQIVEAVLAEDHPKAKALGERLRQLELEAAEDEASPPRAARSA